MGKVVFENQLLQFGNNTGIEVPEDKLLELNAGKKPLVKVNVNGYKYSNAVASMKGKYLISFSSEHRKNTGLNGGDTIRVELELDTTPRTVELPEDLKSALLAKPGAMEAFEKLAPSHKKQLVLAVESAKTEETRQRRIAKAIDMLLNK